MNNYLFITLDRYDSSNSQTSTFKSKMEPLQAFRLAYMENIADKMLPGEEADYYEEEIAINLKCSDTITSYDGEEVSYILLKIK